MQPLILEQPLLTNVPVWHFIQTSVTLQRWQPFIRSEHLAQITEATEVLWIRLRTLEVHFVHVV